MDKSEVEKSCAGGEDSPHLSRNRSFKSKQLVRSQAIRESHSPPRTVSPYPTSPVNDPETSDDKDAGNRENGSKPDSAVAGEEDRMEEKKQPVEIQDNEETGYLMISGSWDGEEGTEQRQRTKRWLGNRHHSDSSRDLLSHNPRLACVCGACECNTCRGQRRKHDCPVKQDSGIACSVDCPDCAYEQMSPNGDGVRKSGSFEDQTSYCRCPAERTARQDRARNFAFTRSDSDIAEPSWLELVSFIKGTLNKNPRDRATMLKIEKDLHAFVNDAGRCVVRFPVMTSYGRMLVHRCAALFQLSHRLDSVHKSTVVVSKNGTSGGRIPCTSFRQWCTATFPRSPPPKSEDTCAKSILKRAGTAEEACAGAAGAGARSLEQREREYQLVRRRIFSTDNGTQETEWPWLTTGPIKLLTPEPGRNKLIKVQSLESRGVPETATRGAVSKSHSLDGYGADPPQTRLLSRQGDLASSSWRLSPSSSGYKTLSLRSTDSVTPSPTGCPSPEGTAPSTTPTAPADGDAAPSATHEAAPPTGPVVWAVTDMSAVPPGAVVIHPQTGRPLTHADGSLYHFDPANPPIFQDETFYLQNGHQDPSGEKRRGRLEKQHSFIDNDCDCATEECSVKCCCDCPDQEICTKCPNEPIPSPRSSKPNSIPNSPVKGGEPAATLTDDTPETTNQTPAYENTTNPGIIYDNSTNQTAYDDSINQEIIYDDSTTQTPSYENSTTQVPEYENSTTQTAVYENSTNQRPAYDNSTNQRPAYDNSINQKQPESTSQYSPSRSRQSYIPRYDSTNRYSTNSRYEAASQDISFSLRQATESSSHQRQASETSILHRQQSETLTPRQLEAQHEMIQRAYENQRYEPRPPSYDQARDMQKEVMPYMQSYLQYRNDEITSPPQVPSHYQAPDIAEMQAMIAQKLTPVPVQDPNIRPMSIAANMMYPAAVHQAYPYVNQCRLEQPLQPLYQPLVQSMLPPTAQQLPEEQKHAQTTFRIDPSYPYATDFNAACGACTDPSALQHQQRSVNVGYGQVEMQPTVVPQAYPMHNIMPQIPPYPYQEAVQWQPLVGGAVAGGVAAGGAHKMLVPEVYPLVCQGVYQPAYNMLYPQMIPQPYPICQSVYPVIEKQPEVYQHRGAVVNNQRQPKRNSASGSSRTTPQTPDEKKVPYEEKSREQPARENVTREVASREATNRETLDRETQSREPVAEGRDAVAAIHPSNEIAVTIAQIKEQLALNSRDKDNRGYRGREEWRRRNSGGGILGSYPVNNFGARVVGRPPNEDAINPAIYNSIRNIQAKQNYHHQQQQQQERRVYDYAQYRDNRHDGRFDSRRRFDRDAPEPRGFRPDALRHRGVNVPLLRPPYMLRQMAPNTWNRRSPGMIPPVMTHPRRPHPDRNPRR